MEAEERQALSIDSQIKEMRGIAERDNLFISAVRTESHSAKDSGERPVFNRILQEVRLGRYNALLTWAPDRLSRNAGDLGRLVDMMDSQHLLEIRTFNQCFTNSPNEKFLLMILGSQAKLENDNRGINVKRGLRALVARGHWPGVPPLGYECDERKDYRGRLRVDVRRAPVIKQMFEKAAEGMSYRKICHWLKTELDFKSPRNKHITLSMTQLTIAKPFYYGEFEYPRGSKNWYKGSHTPIITKELYDKAQKELAKRRHIKSIFRRNLAYTKLMKCGLCGSGICGEEKYKELKDGSISKYTYYGCTRARNRYCELTYIREDILVDQLRDLVDSLSIDELGVRGQLDVEVDRMYRFHRDVMGQAEGYENGEQRDIDVKAYVKYLLREGTIEEKRHVLLNLKSKLVVKDGKVYMAETVPQEETPEPASSEKAIILEIEVNDPHFDRHIMGPERLEVDEPRELPGGFQLVYNGQDLPQTRKQGTLFHFAMIYTGEVNVAETVELLFEYLFQKRDVIKRMRVNRREIRIDKMEFSKVLSEEVRV